ncbi:hypothetical protein ACA910_015228 [Epithemia clementina (nom. ined.)]
MVYGTASAKRLEQATSTELASKRRTTAYDHHQADDDNNNDNFEVNIDLEAESVGSDNNVDDNPQESNNNTSFNNRNFEGITGLLGTMSIKSPNPVQNPVKSKSTGPTWFDMDLKMPSMMYVFKEGDQVLVSVDMLVPGLSKSSFWPKLRSDGLELQVGIVVPTFFIQKNRLILSNQRLDDNSHKATSFKQTSDSVKKLYGNWTTDKPIIGNPQLMMLPFLCEPAYLKWELLVFESRDKDFIEKQGGDAEKAGLWVLSIVMRSTVPRTKPVKGKTRKIQTQHDSSSEEDKQDGEDNGTGAEGHTTHHMDNNAGAGDHHGEGGKRRIRE